MLKDHGIHVNAAAKKYLVTYFAFIYEIRDKFFGNARTVRQIVDEAIKNMNLRLSEVPVDKRKKSSQYTLTLADVKSFKMDKEDSVFAKKSIGFKSR